jgi:hypothetical protein
MANPRDALLWCHAAPGVLLRTTLLWLFPSTLSLQIICLLL